MFPLVIILKTKAGARVDEVDGVTRGTRVLHVPVDMPTAALCVDAGEDSESIISASTATGGDAATDALTAATGSDGVDCGAN